jgi:hypothetical protein
LTNITDILKAGQIVATVEVENELIEGPFSGDFHYVIPVPPKDFGIDSLYREI